MDTEAPKTSRNGDLSLPYVPQDVMRIDDEGKSLLNIFYEYPFTTLTVINYLCRLQFLRKFSVSAVND